MRNFCCGNYFQFQYEWKLIFITKTSHLASLWNGGWGELGNGLLLNSVIAKYRYLSLDLRAGKSWYFAQPRSIIVNYFIQYFERHRLFSSLGKLSTQRTPIGSELLSYWTCLHTTTFMLLRIFSLVETVSLKICERGVIGERRGPVVGFAYGCPGFKSRSNLWSGFVSGCPGFNSTALCK